MNRLWPLTTMVGVACTGGDAATREGAVPLYAVEELRVGSPDDPDQAFTWFRELAVGPDGTIYTLHRREYTVRMHDASGTFLGTIGRQGEGPGEFESPGPMGIRGDSLWVLDYGTYRFSFFGLDGTFLGSRSVPIDLGDDPRSSPPRPRGLLSDGSIYGSSPAWSHLVASGDITTQTLVRLTWNGRVADTLATYPIERTVWEVTDPDDARSFRSYQNQPFADTELLTLAGHSPHVIRVHRRRRSDAEPTFRVTKLALSGDTVFDRRIAYDPVPVDQALVDSLVDSRAASVANSRFGRGTPRELAAKWAREGLYVPEFHPPVTSVLVGRNGSAWLRGEHVGTPQTTWRILSPEGALRGVVELPARFSPLLADGDRVWGREIGALDVPYIVRYRLTAERARAE